MKPGRPGDPLLFHTDVVLHRSNAFHATRDFDGALGIQVTPVTQAVAAQYQLNASVRGLVVADLDPSGPSRGLLFQGDVITATVGRGGAQRPIQTPEQLHDALNAATNGVITLVVYNPQSTTNNRTRVVNVPLTR